MSHQDYQSIPQSSQTNVGKENKKDSSKMGCFGGDDEEGSGKYGKPHHGQLDGPIKNRGCTDIICLILFIAYWVGMVIVAGFAFKNGDPQRLIRPVDSKGLYCGFSDGVKDRPYLHFFDITRCATGAFTTDLDKLFTCNTPQICVKTCPESIQVGLTPSSSVKTDVYCTDGRTVGQHEADGVIAFTQSITDGICPPYYLTTENLLSRCVPLLSVVKTFTDAITTADNDTLTLANNVPLLSNNTKEGVKALAGFLNLRSAAEEVWTDFGKIWPYVLGGLVLILVICFVYIFLIRFLIGPMIYISFIAILVVSIWGISICYKEYAKLQKEPVDVNSANSAENLLDTFRYQKETWLGLGIALTIIVVILILLFIFLRKRIRLAVAVIKESSKALGSIKSAVFFPIITYLLQFMLFAWFVGVGVFLVTSSKPAYAYDNLNGAQTLNYDLVDAEGNTTNYNFTTGVACDPSDTKAQLLVSNNKTAVTLCAFDKFETNDVNIELGGLKIQLFRMQLYHFFGWLWGLNFILAFGQCVLAGAFASYYWAFKKPQDIPTLPVLGAVKRTLFYHTGSLAFGALIIAIVQFIRAVLAYLQAKFEGSENKVAKFLLRCLSCFFWCLEKILKFINKNAYIEIAIYGYNFCKAARTAFNLIMRNIVRVVVINKISSFIMLLGKLIITGAVAIISFYVFDSLRESKDLNYYLVPIIGLTIVAFVVAHGFLNVFDMAIDTIFLCVLEDLERHDGTPENPYYMSDSLQKTLHKKNKKEKVDSDSE